MRLWLTALVITAAGWVSQEGPATLFTTAIARQQLAWQLSEPDEIRSLLGAPASEDARRDGGMELRLWTYRDGFLVVFGREFGTTGPFVLLGAQDGARRLRAEPGSRLMLRTIADLAKLRPFTGLQNVDASHLDLRGEEARVREAPFDTRTLWPDAAHLPADFDPAALLRDGRNPGLGVRALHKAGIDGRGVTIGIIDQPLIDHAETTGRLTLVAQLEVEGVGPQMHGPAVASVAAGASVGVAPGARVAYVSMAMWKAQQSNALYIDALERLLAWKSEGGAGVRVVSISYGGFRDGALADQWQGLLAKAEAAGVLVITCDPVGSRLEFGLLKPLRGSDRETPNGYAKGSYGSGLLVPGDGRTFAHYEGTKEYTYAPKGGLSWGAPYLAGLAALGFQVNANLSPARIRAYLVRSATRMPYGLVVNPDGFVRMCQADPDRGR